MKRITELKFGFSDASNYRRRENRELFNKIFLQTSALNTIHQGSTFFIVGEKGTGKTAYAVHFSNSPIGNNKSTHRYLRETDYHKFVSLRQGKSLTLSDYTDIWKVIIYLLVAESINESATRASILLKYPKFKALRDAIDEYYNHAFSPEISIALQLVENSKLAAELMAKHLALAASATVSRETRRTTNENRFQTNLLTIERTFEDALSSLKLSDNHLLFVDGIDIRPSSVPYPEYLDCVRGLANAIWAVNNDFFPAIKDSPGRMRVIMLLRPDIFNSLGLQNRNTKLRDNAVVLDWRTVYFSHRQSDLFRMADRLFSAQQSEPMATGVAWDHYFPFNATNVRADETYPSSFIALMRYSFHRPRDILTILDVLAELNPNRQDKFDYVDLNTADFRRVYGDYLLGEIKDSLSFYYDEIEFEIFLKFFEFLDGMQKFPYSKFLVAFSEFSDFILTQDKARPGFMRSPDEFLQFLYDQNILCYIEETEENERFIRWCFIERSPSNISPKVKTEMNYEIHYGLANVLNTGKALKNRRRNVKSNLTREVKTVSTVIKNPILVHAEQEKSPPRKRRINPPHAPQSERKVLPNEVRAGVIVEGTIKLYDSKKGFGFIKPSDLTNDVYFRRRALSAGVTPKKGMTVTYELSNDNSGRVVALLVTAKTEGPS